MEIQSFDQEFIFGELDKIRIGSVAKIFSPDDDLYQNPVAIYLSRYDSGQHRLSF